MQVYDFVIELHVLLLHGHYEVNCRDDKHSTQRHLTTCCAMPLATMLAGLSRQRGLDDKVSVLINTYPHIFLKKTKVFIYNGLTDHFTYDLMSDFVISKRMI